MWSLSYFQAPLTNTFKQYNLEKWMKISTLYIFSEQLEDQKVLWSDNTNWRNIHYLFEKSILFVILTKHTALCILFWSCHIELKHKTAKFSPHNCMIRKTEKYAHMMQLRRTMGRRNLLHQRSQLKVAHSFWRERLQKF